MKSLVFSLFIFISLFLLLSCGTESTPVYTLTTSVNGEGTVTPSGGEFEEGETVTLTSTPSEHWVFDSWSSDGSGTSNTISITMDSDKNVVVNFTEREYTINYTINGNGSVEETVIQPKGEYTVGTVVQLTPVPDIGWKFVEWNNWDGEVDEVNRIVVTVDGEVNVSLTFEKKEYPLNITIEGEGTVTETIVQQKTTDYEHGTVVELIPNPSEGWKFVEWSGDVNGNENPLRVTIDREKNITVKFSPIVFLNENEITIMCPNGGVGDIGVVDGVEYEVVDRELLIQRIEEGRGRLTRRVCVSLVTDMSRVFQGLAFNDSIGNWDVSSVTNMEGMFVDSQFNQPIGEWDVSSVTNMERMFAVTPFNQPIGNWDVSNVSNMMLMFVDSQFNQPIGEWDVSSVTNMEGMFVDSQFNQPIGEWNVSSVTNMERMFAVTPFNQPIGNWDVSSVTNMSDMFYDSQFNQPIGNWDVSNVTVMIRMFRLSSFNQDISSWCVWRIGSEPSLFSYESPLTEQNKPVWGTCPD